MWVNRMSTEGKAGRHTRENAHEASGDDVEASTTHHPSVDVLAHARALPIEYVGAEPAKYLVNSQSNEDEQG